MSTSNTSTSRLSLFGAAVGLAHAWIGLFTAAEPGSAKARAEGICYSAVFGLVGGAIFAAGYYAVLLRDG